MRSRHLKDPQLLDLLILGEESAVSHTTARAHLSQCETCRNRSHSLEAFLRDLPTSGHAAFERAYPAERVATQRQRILRRLKRAIEPTVPARVLRFPAMTGPALAGMRRARVWMGAAAAAGLVLGVAIGQVVHVHPEQRGQVAGNDAAAASSGAGNSDVTRRAPLLPPIADPYPASDDPFLDELELVLSSPQVRELTPLDEITPRIREVAVNVW